MALDTDDLLQLAYARRLGDALVHNEARDFLARTYKAHLYGGWEREDGEFIIEPATMLIRFHEACKMLFCPVCNRCNKHAAACKCGPDSMVCWSHLGFAGTDEKDTFRCLANPEHGDIPFRRCLPNSAVFLLSGNRGGKTHGMVSEFCAQIIGRREWDDTLTAPLMPNRLHGIGCESMSKSGALTIAPYFEKRMGNRIARTAYNSSGSISYWELADPVGDACHIMCFRGDQRLLMADGTWREIERVGLGDRVLSRGGPASVVQLHSYDDAPMLKLRLKGGFELVSTENHRHALQAGGLKEASRIQMGESLDADPFARPPAIAPCPWPRWALGWTAVMIGDGCIKFNQASFSAAPGGRVLRDLPPMPPECKLKYVQGQTYHVTLTRRRNMNPLVQHLKCHGLWGKGSRDKFIPDEVFRQSPNDIAFFLRHLWNTDGSFNRKNKQAVYGSISRRLVYDVKYLCWAIGVHASVSQVDGFSPYHGHKIRSYHATVSGGSWDRFMAAIAGKPFEDVGTTRLRCGRAWQTIEQEAGKVYCIGVDDPSHQILVDGVWTENSYEQWRGRGGAKGDGTNPFEGVGWFSFCWDEPMPQGCRDAVTRGLVNSRSLGGGRELGAMTPLHSLYVLRGIHDRAWNLGGDQRGLHVVYGTIHDNPSLTSVAVQQTIESWSPEEREARALGRFQHLEGRVHPEFEDASHVFDDQLWDPLKDATGAASDWMVVMAADPHPRKLWAMIWVAISEKGDWCVVREWPDTSYPPYWSLRGANIKGKPPTFDAYAEVLREVERSLPGGPDMVIHREMDPNMGLSPATGSGYDTIQRAMAVRGYHFRADVSDNRPQGIQAVRELVAYDSKQPVSELNRPRFRVAASCRNTIWSFHNLIHKEWANSDREPRPDVEDAGKDFWDAVRYLAMRKPLYRDWRTARASFDQAKARQAGKLRASRFS